MATDGFVAVDGGRLHYLEWGDRRHPHVLLLHGWDGTAHYWDLIAPDFADRHHLVGASLGGMIALAYVSEHLAQVQRSGRRCRRSAVRR